MSKWDRLTKYSGRRWNQNMATMDFFSSDGYRVSTNELRAYANRRPAGMSNDRLLDEIVEDRAKKSKTVDNHNTSMIQ